MNKKSCIFRSGIHFVPKKKKKKKKIKFLCFFYARKLQYFLLIPVVCKQELNFSLSLCVSFHSVQHNMSPVKQICVFQHSVITNFNCACPAIQRGQGSGFLSEGSSRLTACMSEQRRFWRDFAARISDKYQIRLTRSILIASKDHLKCNVHLIFPLFSEKNF